MSDEFLRRITFVMALSVLLLLICYQSVLAGDKYGAIAISPSTGIIKYAYDFPSKSAAEKSVLQACRKAGAKDGVIAVWFKNGCGALAVGKRKYSGGAGKNKQQAQKNALKSCSRYTSNCQIKCWACTGR